ncbi:BMP family ABC transporter substrate-binding protein [Kaistia algarum]|uniref:BMP family ABC transporter substrate-binding protein n=1 Tax=Kaistia algarum TaxID=2083279 RepID=UPI000CE76287|nr:BMP family ABC transporter substrate-binding protein [Kaistia algarum]MCX5514820.1 BMP family ABC transporter substrate-binding protein [Kaistia algarum]PPE79581.1 BMP family ABC transporter substrate-binding protein [Kaistia algarum]
MKKYLAVIGAFALIAGLATGASAADKLKVCFVYTGPHNDGGWSQQHDTARLALEAKFGDKIETAYVENVAEGPDAERAIERLARSGCGMIFTTSFGFMDPTIKIAKKFPKVKFEHDAGYKMADNVSIYNMRWYEGRYVQGQIAAKMSKTGVAGYIVSFPIPEVVMGIDAFMLGAQSVNPDFKVKVVWVNTWFDPGKEADAAKALIDQGVDIIVQHTDSPAAMQIAEERGLHAFGQSADMSKFGPKAHLASLVDNWTPYYIDRVQAALDGTWKSTDTWGGIKSGMVELQPLTNMPDDVKALAESTMEKIKSGELQVFKGPITKQDGSVGVADGAVMDDKTLSGLNWYVKGIDDKLPQ